MVAGETVIYEVKDHIATITLNRPEKRNAINRPMRAEVEEAFKDVKYNDDVWVAIITGNGPVFCAGKDLLDSVKLGDIPGIGMTIVDGRITSERSRNTPPAERLPSIAPS